MPTLVSQSLGFGGYRHILWLDNLFMSVPLLNTLRRLGYGCCGTVRNDASRGYPVKLQRLRELGKESFQRGQQHHEIDDSNVLHTLWRDQSLMAFMSNISEP